MEYSAIPAEGSGSGKPTHAPDAGTRNDQSPLEGNGVMTRVRNFSAGVLDSVKSRLPDTSNLYLQPLNPSEDISPADRLSLILQSARPWGEFLNIREFNLPPLNQLTARLGQNIETYFYNYFLLACLHFVLFTLFHFGPVFVFVAWLLLLYVLYVANGDDIHIGSLTVDANVKLVIAIISAVLVIIFGDVFTLIFSIAIFLLIVVGIHGIVRDDAPDIMNDVAI